MSKSIQQLALITFIILLSSLNANAFETMTNQPKTEDVIIDYSVIENLKLEQTQTKEKKLKLPGLDKKENARWKKEEIRRKKALAKKKAQKAKQPKPIVKVTKIEETPKPVAEPKPIAEPVAAPTEDKPTSIVPATQASPKPVAEPTPVTTQPTATPTPTKTETKPESVKPLIAETPTPIAENTIDENYNIIKFDADSTNLTTPIITKIDNFVNSITDKKNTYIKIISYNFIEGDTFKSRRTSLNRALSIRTNG